MCSRHWRMVPKKLQREVWRTYRPGQEITKTPSAEYLKAADAAVKAVRQAESGRLPKSTPKRPKPLPSEGSTGYRKPENPEERLGDSPNAWPEWAESGLAIGMVVLVDALAQNDRRPLATGCIIGLKQTGMVVVDVGIPGNPYTCAPERLTKYDGVVNLWRLGQMAVCDRPGCQPHQSARPFTCQLCEARSRPHWWYVGEMSAEAHAPRWPDAVWFPAGYDPNERRFE